MTNKLMDPKEAANYLNVPLSWVRRQVRLNVLPTVRLGHYTRFRRESLDDFIKEKERGLNDD